MSKISAVTFQTRRKALIDLVRDTFDTKNPVLVFSAYTQQQASHDMAHKFTQEANFAYLTGIHEPDWQLIIDTTDVEKSWLVAPEKSDVHVVFDGILSAEKAVEMSGVDGVLTFVEGQEKLETLAGSTQKVFALGDDPHAEYYDFALNPSRPALKKKLEEQFGSLEDVRASLAKLRAIKSLEEISSIQNAVDLTVETFEKVRNNLSEFSKEYEIEAEFNKAFRVTGAGGHAYEPIVAGGSHAVTLHYGENNDELPENGLVLLDIGAKIDGYAADITRTYAVGTPTERQKQVHAAVEKAHHKIIELIKPELDLKIYQEQVDEIMKDALEEVGLLKDRNDAIQYRQYFPHAIGHGLGLDVHESLGGFGVLKPGVVLTVEPGIYIAEEGIGVRIEDDILVTEDGYRNLSQSLSTSL